MNEVYPNLIFVPTPGLESVLKINDQETLKGTNLSVFFREYTFWISSWQK